MKIAQIYINQLNMQLDRPFDYGIPKNLEPLVKPGVRVAVPFGFANKTVDGLVADVSEAGEEKASLKEILGLVEGFPVLDEKQLSICFYIQQRYHAMVMDTANVYYPGSIQLRRSKDKDGQVHFLAGPRKRERFYWALEGALEDSGLEALLGKVRSNAKVQQAVLTLLREKTGDEEELVKNIPGAKDALKALEKKGLVRKHEKTEEEPIHQPPVKTGKKPELTRLQRQVLEDFNLSTKKTHLIHGVTGSGKTEIYLRMMESALQENKTCLYLVPEISLTPQTIHRIQERFGREIAVIHSRVGEGERLEMYRKIASKEITIVVGARSAILSPFQDLGLIVIDEEHENTYKSSTRPRFETVDLAQEMARLHGAKVVLGSATPSVGSYYKALNGRYELHRLPERVYGQEMPPAILADMREELKRGNRSILSGTLYRKMKETLERKEQIILFLNKRGYYSYVFCRDCGYVVKCDKCDVAMTYHRQDNRLECHYCKSAAPVRQYCPECGSKKLKYSGSGTERTQMLLEKYFPGARVLRMDTDSMRKKDAVANAVEDFAKGEADILLGTQMVTKGFDFENVTLVGVLLADLTLNFPDYRASERTFQLVTQVAGRAGRGKKRGTVVIQTYDPQHYAIQRAKEHDYEGFFVKELEYRNRNQYPPFSTLFYIGFSGNREEDVEKECGVFRRMLVERIQGQGDFLKMDVYPPSKSGIVRVNNRYRYYVLVKTKHPEIFHEAIFGLQRDSAIQKFKSVMIVDVNPNFIF